MKSPFGPGNNPPGMNLLATLVGKGSRSESDLRAHVSEVKARAAHQPAPIPTQIRRQSEGDITIPVSLLELSPISSAPLVLVPVPVPVPVPTSASPVPEPSSQSAPVSSQSSQPANDPWLESLSLLVRVEPYSRQSASAFDRKAWARRVATSFALLTPSRHKRFPSLRGRNIVSKIDKPLAAYATAVGTPEELPRLIELKMGVCAYIDDHSPDHRGGRRKVLGAELLFGALQKLSDYLVVEIKEAKTNNFVRLCQDQERAIAEGTQPIEGIFRLEGSSSTLNAWQATFGACGQIPSELTPVERASLLKRIIREEKPFADLIHPWLVQKLIEVEDPLKSQDLKLLQDLQHAVQDPSLKALLGLAKATANQAEHTKMNENNLAITLGMALFGSACGVNSTDIATQITAPDKAQAVFKKFMAVYTSAEIIEGRITELQR